MYFRKIFRENYLFFIFFGLYLLVGSILLFFVETGDLIKFLGEHRSENLDSFFKNFTKMGEEWSYIFLIIILLFIRFGDALFVLLLGGMVTVVSFGLKKVFAHPRPITYFKSIEEWDSIQVVDGLHVIGGMTSFPSGHTMSGFALFGFLALISKNKTWMNVLMFITAFGVAISRVYLVHHFLKDIVFGAFLGVMIAILFHWLLEKYIWRKPSHQLNRSLFNRSKMEGV